MRKKTFIIFLIVTMFLDTIAFSSLNAIDYTIGPGDELEISVIHRLREDESAHLFQGTYSIEMFGNEIYTKKLVTVGPDGKITLPLVGTIKADGLSIPRLTEILTKKLQNYIVNPRLTINIKNYTSYYVYILGEVKNPGRYHLKGKTNILELISLAGGTTDRARLGKIWLYKKGENRKKINLNKIIKEDLSNQDLILEPGDSVAITKKWWWFDLNKVFMLVSIVASITIIARE